jgi:hypothetical protein
MVNIKQAFFRLFGLLDGIREINNRYKVPRIQMTPLVKVSLLFLRIYLFFMIAVLLYKFILIAAFHQ